MCGIAGFVGHPEGAGAAEARLRAMCNAIEHRGPDDAGYFVQPGVALGMRRLSIIDVAGGHQPLGNEDGSLQLVFNGEIYNFRELQARLRAGGHSLATNSDTETIVHLYEDRGDALVDDLRGMFGFALWDGPRQRLLLARDRLGIKPLYYAASADGVAFASELRPLLATGLVSAEIDPVALLDYFSLGYVPDPRSIFKGVHKLPPGHRLTWTRAEGVRISRYWSPNIAEQPGISVEDAVQEIRRLLDESVQLHLESEVPLGAFLSGGIDSSAVVATMKRVAGGDVRTFSIGFDEAEYDESAHAANVARALGTRHTELVVRPEADSLVEDVVHTFDEPFADSSAIPTFLVCQLARQHVTVALSGDGGDELFGGYERYARTLSRPRVPSPVLRSLLRAVSLAMPLGARGRGYLHGLGRSARGQYATSIALPHTANEGGVLRRELAETAGAFDTVLDRWFEGCEDRDFPSQLMLVDLQSYLPGDILAKVDRTSMASSLEARVPLLDHRFAEFAMSLPSSLKMRGGVGKWIFREAIRDRVPDIVLSHPKRGFTVPLTDWFRGPLSYRLDALLAPGARVGEYVDPVPLRRVVDEHRTGKRGHAGLLWRILALELWLDGLSRGLLKRPPSISRLHEFVSARGTNS